MGGAGSWAEADPFLPAEPAAHHSCTAKYPQLLVPEKQLRLEPHFWPVDTAPANCDLIILVLWGLALAARHCDEQGALPACSLRMPDREAPALQACGYARPT